MDKCYAKRWNILELLGNPNTKTTTLIKEIERIKKCDRYYDLSPLRNYIKNQVTHSIYGRVVTNNYPYNWERYKAEKARDEEHCKKWVNRGTIEYTLIRSLYWSDFAYYCLIQQPTMTFVKIMKY
jgi:hypothetical protein